MKNQILEKVKDAIRNPYAWPGGYPVYTLLADGVFLCPKCARENYKQIAHDTGKIWNTGWRAVGATVLWEGAETCGHCNCELESAYGDPEEN